VAPPGSTESPPRLPFTPRVKQVIELSAEEAHGFGHEYIGTEHLLLGLLREGGGVASQLLLRHGADLDTVRLHVTHLLPDPPPIMNLGT
jgi:ATP-dependent Clp protease ATP-binding subunit ClpC